MKSHKPHLPKKSRIPGQFRDSYEILLEIEGVCRRLESIDTLCERVAADERINPKSAPGRAAEQVMADIKRLRACCTEVSEQAGAVIKKCSELFSRRFSAETRSLEEELHRIHNSVAIELLQLQKYRVCNTKPLKTFKKSLAGNRGCLQEIMTLINRLAESLVNAPPRIPKLPPSDIHEISKQVNNLVGHKQMCVGEYIASCKDGRMPSLTLPEAILIHNRHILKTDQKRGYPINRVYVRCKNGGTVEKGRHREAERAPQRDRPSTAMAWSLFRHPC